MLRLSPPSSGFLTARPAHRRIGLEEFAGTFRIAREHGLRGERREVAIEARAPQIGRRGHRPDPLAISMLEHLNPPSEHERCESPRLSLEFSQLDPSAPEQ